MMGLFKKDKLTGDEILFSTKWLEVRRRNGWFLYTHAPWTKGIGVAVLAYRQAEGGSGEIEYVGRYEVTPSHCDVAKLCSITGGYDNSHKYSIAECALNELREEGGWDAPLSAVTELGIVHSSKSSDTVMHLFAVNLDADDVKPCEATGDGTGGEHGSYAMWVTEDELIEATDSLNHTMILRLHQELGF